jgi:hypothetical protein
MDDASLFQGSKKISQNGDPSAGLPVQAEKHAVGKVLRGELIDRPQLTENELLEVARYRDKINTVAQTLPQTLEQDIAKLLSSERNLLDPENQLVVQKKLSGLVELMRKGRESFGSLPLVGGFFDTCFRMGEAVVERVQEALFSAQILAEQLALEKQLQTIALRFTPERRAEILVQFGSIQLEHDAEDCQSINLASTNPETYNKKLAEAARRLTEDLINEIERLEQEKKKHEAEEDLLKEQALSLEEKIAKCFPDAGHDPRVAQLISAEISGIFQDYTEFDVRIMVERILRVLEGDAEVLQSCLER